MAHNLRAGLYHKSTKNAKSTNCDRERRWQRTREGRGVNSRSLVFYTFLHLLGLCLFQDIWCNLYLRSLGYTNLETP